MTLLACALAVSALAVTAAEQPRPSIEYRPSLLIQLSVADLDRAISFYTTVRGFTTTERRDDQRFAHLDTNVPGLQIGLNAVAEPKGTGSAVLNVGVANVADARRLLESRGAKFRGETVGIRTHAQDRAAGTGRRSCSTVTSVRCGPAIETPKPTALM